MNNNAEKIKELYNKLKAGKVVSVDGVKPTYEKRVASLIRAKYTASEEFALINNYNLYLQDNSLVEYKAEYDSYQAYRTQCKRNAEEAD